MKHARLILLVACLTPVFAHAASVALFSFTTNSQVVSPNELSAPITIQSQNSSGMPEPITETFDLTFVSSSPTGQFLGGTGKTASKTMGKNSSNRTFYYKDSTPGDFTLTVTATGRVSKQSFKMIQNIVIGTLPAAPRPQKIITQPTSNTSATKVAQQSTSSVAEIGTSTNPLAGTVVFQATSHEGFLSRIFSLPQIILHFIKRLFVEE